MLGYNLSDETHACVEQTSCKATLSYWRCGSISVHTDSAACLLKCSWRPYGIFTDRSGAPWPVSGERKRTLANGLLTVFRRGTLFRFFADYRAQSGSSNRCITLLDTYKRSAK